MRRSLGIAAVALAAGLSLVVVGGSLVLVGGIVGRTPARVSAPDGPSSPVDRLEQTIVRSQDQLRRVPGDWRTWAALGMAYLERARITADPTYYPKAEEAVLRSLVIRPDENTDALVAQGALANARHDFAAARRWALAATRSNDFNAEAYAVLADAETQLGNRDAATAAVQRLLDLRPGLSAYARASYDLEQRGRTTEASDLMRRALAVAVDRHDVAFCRTQLGDLALNSGNPAAADTHYSAGLAAEPTSVALLRGRARAAAASRRSDEALAAYAALTRSAPTPAYLLEYAELLRAAGRGSDADAQLRLAMAAHQLFTGNGGVDGLTGAALAQASGRPDEALREARAEWSRRQHADVADVLAWALHLSNRDAEALPLARRATGTGAHSAGYTYHLAMIELSLGDRAAARDHLRMALDINPYFSPLEAPTARRALAGLGS